MTLAQLWWCCLAAATAQSEHEMQHRPPLDVVLLGRLVVVHLFTYVDQQHSHAHATSFQTQCCLVNYNRKGGKGRPPLTRQEARDGNTPAKMRRCWMGGMPSFSSTLSLMRSTVSVGSMSISISRPVSVFTLIVMPPRTLTTARSVLLAAAALIGDSPDRSLAPQHRWQSLRPAHTN